MSWMFAKDTKKEIQLDRVRRGGAGAGGMRPSGPQEGLWICSVKQEIMRAFFVQQRDGV